MNAVLKITPLITTWAFGLSFMYLWGYWDRVGVNVFEYLGVGEIVIYASPTLVVLTILLSLLMGIGLIVYKLLEKVFGSVAQAVSSKRVEKTAEVFFWIGGALLLLWLFSSEHWLVLVLGMMFGVAAGALEQLTWYQKLVPSALTRRFLAVLSAVSMATAFDSGRDKYDRVMSEETERRVVLSTDLIEQSRFPEPQYLIYLGKAGDYFFFSPEDGSGVVLTQFSSFKNLYFIKAKGRLKAPASEQQKN